MFDGFIKAGVCSPDLKVADCECNTKQIIKKALELSGQGVKLLVFPEFSLTGYTCSDLFLQEVLLAGAVDSLGKFSGETKQCDTVFVVGLPLVHQGRLYNVAAVVFHGEVLGLVPKSHIPTYSEFYEGRHFSGGDAAYQAGENREVPCTTHKLPFMEKEVCFGVRQLFVCEQIPEFSIAAEICEDLWVPVPPSSYHAMAGASVIVNPSASDEVTGKSAYRRELVKGQSARTVTAYLYANASGGESTTDLVYAGHNVIAENGILLAENASFEKNDLITEIDVKKLASERRRMTTFPVYQSPEEKGYTRHVFAYHCLEKTELTRTFEKTPFVPSTKNHREERCNEILNIQAAGLAKRLRHTGCKSAVIGLSGGLDSTLALLVTIRAFDQLSLDRKGIICVTMPCFGTTDRTYENAVNLARELGTELREISIEKAVLGHFEDIGHDANVHDITYENGQARERTQILMNIANQAGGLVIGTGDLSELALGWATYNGDHMSMYGVNCSVPKTLVRYLVQYYADTCGGDHGKGDHEEKNETLKRVLYDILDTPVSPELLPPKDGRISQKTEDIVGPYELHDFYLYYILRFGFMPSKVFRMAAYTFQDVYGEKTIYKWLHTFYHRFFRQQFKRSCIPDGPKVGSVAVSPRGDLRMPSDASDALWKADLERVNPEKITN
ncbi:MAG: NAD(+) synthase [Roseburia sp.]|nr:NAD(+) synthase [Roseburia sp.]